MDPVSIRSVPEAAQPAPAGEIERELLQALASQNTQATNRLLMMTAHDSEGQLIGGVTGATSYGWLLVKTLWVHSAHRGGGIGTRLMQSIEESARAAGCHGAWLDTSSPPAREFYQNLGYAPFGALENGPGHPPTEHCRWFMSKPLSNPT